MTFKRTGVLIWKGGIVIGSSTKTTIDLYLSTTAYRQIVHTAPTLANRVNSMAVVILTKQTAVEETDVAIDRISLR